MVKSAIFSKSKMAADETGNTLKNAVTSEWFIRFTPNLVSSIYSSPERGQRGLKPEILNPRWPPAANLKFTKTLITFESSVRFSPNLTWSFIWTSPRQSYVKTCHISKSDDENANFGCRRIFRFMPFSTVPVASITSEPPTSSISL